MSVTQITKDTAMQSESKKSIVVVTGGASGIGEACVREFAKNGATVAIVDIAKDSGQRLAEEVQGSFYYANVVEEGDILRAADNIEADFGAVHTLITSAGIGQVLSPPEELSMENWDLVVDTNFRGTYVTCAIFGSRMASRGYGTIVTIASITGMRATPVHAYGPSKSAIISLTAGLAAEWGRSGVRVNAVSPGFTLTAPVQAAFDSGQRDRSLIEDNTALRRLVRPDEVAKAVAYLASDEASAITGINLPVDAGWLTVGPQHTYGGIPPARTDSSD
jgi:NAD(P)-dependent dehydrogenase (short-subunit alcohol dehydrogenase family)